MLPKIDHEVPFFITLLLAFAVFVAMFAVVMLSFAGFTLLFSSGSHPVHIFPDWGTDSEDYFVWVEGRTHRLFWAIAPEGKDPTSFSSLPLREYATPSGVVSGAMVQIWTDEKLSFFAWREKGAYIFFRKKEGGVWSNSYSFDEVIPIIPLPPGYVLWLSADKRVKNALKLSG